MRKFLCLYPSLVTFWGTLVTNDAKIVIFAFYIFRGRWGQNVCWGHDHPLDTPLIQRNDLACPRLIRREQTSSTKKHDRFCSEPENDHVRSLALHCFRFRLLAQVQATLVTTVY